MTAPENRSGNTRISDHLKELLNAEVVDIQYQVTGKDGKPKVYRNRLDLNAGGKIGKALAARMIWKALADGDLPTMKEIGDRTEGKAIQTTIMGINSDNVQPYLDRLADLMQERDDPQQQIENNGYTEEDTSG